VIWISSNGKNLQIYFKLRGIYYVITHNFTFCLWLTTPESRGFSDGFVAIASSESKTVRIYCHPQFQDKLKTYALDEDEIVLNDGRYAITITPDEGEFRRTYAKLSRPYIFLLNIFHRYRQSHFQMCCPHQVLL
jgi:hypothetical protein